jgi:ectoine hydroxylase-related dioxygenase (phytanoyl-CoA dioxygenase family)
VSNDQFFPPYRDLSDAEIQTFSDNGVAHIPDVVDPAWIPQLGALIEAQQRTPSERAGDSQPGATLGRSFSDRYLWPTHEGFRAFAFEAGLAGLAGQAMGSRQIRLYFDHIFTKAPKTEQGTPWHQDLPYWPFRGTQICTIWLTLHDVDLATSGLRFIRGSHTWGKWFRPTPLGPQLNWVDENEAEPIPDFDAQPEQYEQLSFELKAGDALIFSPMIVHGAGANQSGSTPRVAFATRWLGDDAAWDPRPGTDPIVGPQDVDLASGDLARDPSRFPLVWQQGASV